MPTRSRSRSADSDHGTAPYASSHYRGRNCQLRDLGDLVSLAGHAAPSDWGHHSHQLFRAAQRVSRANSSRAYAPILKQWNNVFFPDRNDFDHEEPTGDRLAEREDRNEARAIFRNAWGSAHHASPTAGPSTPRRSCD
ncbi:hypothetical protein B0H14DRAFT_3168309 [Mycena olivaceomarginata]|nr:hypothetical protein B0H14DRAFT_3168309 [Mycena olivaceomarginata]